MKINLTKRDVIWSYLGTIFSMGSNFFMLPFLMYFLDNDDLGLWYVFISIGSLTNLFDMGFAVTFSRNITYSWSGAKSLKKNGVEFSYGVEPDFSLMKQVLSTCKFIYACLSLSALFFLLTIGTWYITYIGNDLNNNIHIISWIIFSFAIYLNLYYGYFSSFLRGVGAVERVNKNIIIARLIQIILTVVLLYLDFGIIGVCIAYLTYGTIFMVLGKYYFYSYNNIGLKLSAVQEKTSKTQIVSLLKVVWHNAWRDGTIAISNYFSIQASVIICSFYLSLSQTAIYSIGVQITTAIAQIAATLYNAYQPEIQSAYIRKDLNSTQRTMSLIVISFLGIFFFGTILYLIIGHPLLRLIQPSAVVSESVFLGLALYQLIIQFRNCYTSYFSCTNRILYMKSFLFSSFLCVILSLIAVGLFGFGLWGLIVAQIISQSVYNLWKWPYLAHKELQLNFFDITKIGLKEGLNSLKTILKIGQHHELQK